MTDMTTDTIEQPQPARSRAVFSQEDFGLIRTAIAHYLKEVQDQPESVKYANLYHRLGRVA
jgi:predicted Zn-dependent peptidase